MSFLGNLTDQFGELGIGGEKRSSGSYQSSPPPNNGNYGYHAPGQGAPPPAQYYASPPQPTYQPPPNKPPLPQGWTPLFDQSRQRWYYANRDTGVTQWEAPGYVPPRPPMGTTPSQESRPSAAHSPYPPAAPPAPYGQTPGSHSASSGPPPSSAHYGDQRTERGTGDKGIGKGGLLLGAAGGLVAGVVGGELLHHAIEHEEEKVEDRLYNDFDRPPMMGNGGPGYGYPTTEYVSEYNTEYYSEDVGLGNLGGTDVEYEETTVVETFDNDGDGDYEEEVVVEETRYDEYDDGGYDY